MKIKDITPEWLKQRAGKSIYITTPTGFCLESFITMQGCPVHPADLYMHNHLSSEYEISDTGVSTNKMLGKHIGCMALVDFGDTSRLSVITPVLIADIHEQFFLYSREITVKPLLLPLSEITEQELYQCRELSPGFKYSGENPQLFMKDVKCFTPAIFDYLLTKFDLYGLLDKGLAINKTKFDKNYKPATV